MRHNTAPARHFGVLIDTLASKLDALRLCEKWTAMRFDRPLAVGAVEGHGPIGYRVEDYRRGRDVRFRFTRPPGFEGYHAFHVEPIDEVRTLLLHEFIMETRGSAVLSWPLVFRPLHDALIEDSLDTAEFAATGGIEHPAQWSLLVRLLRDFLRRAGAGTN